MTSKSYLLGQIEEMESYVDTVPSWRIRYKNRITKIWYITNPSSRISVKGAGTAITGRGVIIEDVVEVASSTLAQKVGVVSWSRSRPRVSRSSVP